MSAAGGERNGSFVADAVASRPFERETAPMTDWAPGFTQSELDKAQERYGIRFPPDLSALLQEKSPARGYDWAGDDERIPKMLAWPTDMLLFDVDNGLWWPEWGVRPLDQEACHQIVRDAVSRAPRLVPVIGHRYIPDSPDEAGNPVFSMYGFDTIYYGANLAEYFDNELSGTHHIGAPRRIAFWSDLAEGHERVFSDVQYVR